MDIFLRSYKIWIMLALVHTHAKRSSRLLPSLKAHLTLSTSHVSLSTFTVGATQTDASSPWLLLISLEWDHPPTSEGWGLTTSVDGETSMLRPKRRWRSIVSAASASSSAMSSATRRYPRALPTSPCLLQAFDRIVTENVIYCCSVFSYLQIFF